MNKKNIIALEEKINNLGKDCKSKDCVFSSICDKEHCFLKMIIFNQPLPADVQKIIDEMDTIIDHYYDK